MEKQHINPPELFKPPSYTRIITVTGPSKLIFIAGQTPSDESYRPPPSTLVGVTRLSHPDFLIEIDLMAVTNGQIG